jgi:hypothetical protein
MPTIYEEKKLIRIQPSYSPYDLSPEEEQLLQWA